MWCGNRLSSPPGDGVEACHGFHRRQRQADGHQPADALRQQDKALNHLVGDFPQPQQQQHRQGENGQVLVEALHHRKPAEQPAAEGSLNFSIDGLNMDAVYANLVRQIAGDSLSSTQGETLQESVARDEAKQELLKKIASLEMKIRKEKQLNRKMELNAELKKIRKKMESLLGGR